MISFSRLGSADQRTKLPCMPQHHVNGSHIVLILDCVCTPSIDVKLPKVNALWPCVYVQHFTNETYKISTEWTKKGKYSTILNSPSSTLFVNPSIFKINVTHSSIFFLLTILIATNLFINLTQFLHVLLE